MIQGDSSFSEHLDYLGTGLVEKLAVMRDDEISSLPGILEVFLEPLDTREVDEVRWFIEEEKIWT